MPAASTTDVPTFGDRSVVDADLHVLPESADAVAEHLPTRFRGKGVSAPDGNWTSPVGRFADDAGPQDGPPGSDPGHTVEHHLDRHGIDHAVVTGGSANLRAAALPDARYAHALTAAYNEWLAETWLDEDDRLYGSISVSPMAPDRAAEAIRRWADHPRMVQVVMGGGTQIPLGQDRYWPIYEAAEAEGLPVAIHAGAEGYGVASPNSGAGYPTTYLERQSIQPCNAMGQLLSLVFEGVPVEFPGIQFVLVGSGYGWLPSFLWRADKNWKGPSQDIPWVERPPSEYVYDHVSFVTPRLEAADTPEYSSRLFEMVDGEALLAYGSDYPHWDYAVPDVGSLGLDESAERALLSGNATTLYDF